MTTDKLDKYNVVESLPKSATIAHSVSRPGADYIKVCRKNKNAQPVYLQITR